MGYRKSGVMMSESPIVKKCGYKRHKKSGLKMTVASGDEPKISREQIKKQKQDHKSTSGGLSFGEYVKVNKETGSSTTKSIIPKINLPKINMPKIKININLNKKPKGAKYGIQSGRRGFAQLRKD
jgi:hypothetical protein